MMPQLDFFYFIGSTYTYLTVMRIAEVAQREGIIVNWRPFNGRAVMTEHPFYGKPVKCGYMWRDVERRAARLDIEWAGIPPYPIERPNLPNRIAVVAAQEGWAPEYSKASYRAWFLKRHNLEDEKVLADVLASIGKDAVSVLA
jgi:2-hydroxychromene-2-carboxylate isomerase